MPSRRANTHRTRSGVASLVSLLLASMLQLTLALLTASTAIKLRAQTVPSPPESPYTLHVYTRRLEIPTLVLPSPHPPVDAQKFTVSLDSGPRFHPNHIRLEGNDPITLAILLDVSGDQSRLLAAFKQSMPMWVALSFRPQDHVSIYAVDCSLLQTDNYQIPNPSVLGHGLDVAITSPLSHGNKTRGSCANTIRLRDSMNVVIQHMAQLPGRRILLVVSNGYDGKSKLPWSALPAEATGNDVSVFALTSQDHLPLQAEQSLNSLIEQTGGLYFFSTADSLPKILANFINLLRSRFILDFPMPANFSSGHHLIAVTIDKSNALIRPSGIAVPLPDPSIAKDPTTIPSSNPCAPIIGTQRAPAPKP
jgi:hypothetical protein